MAGETTCLLGGSQYKHVYYLLILVLYNVQIPGILFILKIAATSTSPLINVVPTFQ